MNHLTKIFFVTALILLVGCTTLQRSSPTIKIQQAIPSAEPKNITLLLPSSGALAHESQAIYNGFLTAYYYDKQQTGHELNIRVTDVTTGNIQDIYQQTLNENPDIIVGPLTKPSIEALTTATISIPTIALNTLDNYQTQIIPNLYQFGLATQDETIQVADKILENQRLHTAIMLPDNSWGKTIANNFQHQYTIKGGTISSTIGYSNQTDFNQAVQQLLNIVKQRVPDPKHPHSSKTKTQISHREDVDAIFLIAQPEIARQIVPLLKFYANDIPIYAISTIYNGNPNPMLDQDLNSAFFCDMPWIIKNPTLLSPQLQAIREQIMTLWPDFANYAKFYALGIDAYFLATSLNKLTANPQATIDGATGILHLDSYNHVYRTLDWTQVQQGVPQ